MKRGKEPIKLLQKWVTLHITPGIFSPLDSNFCEVLCSDDIIKNEHVINITSWLISITWGSDEIEIPH
jgi:hypothetical protein